ncbi:hypothetical protein EP7_005634 (plasmid) [Isosphaeraceae bacterium EP7]
MATLTLAESPCAHASDIDALASAEWLSRPVGYTAQDESDYLAGRLLSPREIADREEAEAEIAMLSSMPAEAWALEFNESRYVFEA